MGTVHLLNVGPGDCTIIQHGSGRVSMVDICCGNDDRTPARNSAVKAFEAVVASGNLRMCDTKSHPLEYLARLSVDRIWRFILTHPDMDHMDGLAALLAEYQVLHYWDSGVRREAPDFSAAAAGFLEADWKAYEALIAGKAVSVGSAVKTVEALAGRRFNFANLPDDDNDYLHILAPDKRLRDEASASADVNDGSYALLYRNGGGRVVLPGDAYDDTWDHIIANYSKSVSGCAFLLAPHHGRDSDRSYDYLDVLRPSLTLIGCAPSKHIKYEAWRQRGLHYITSNQAGNVVLRSAKECLNVYVENPKYAEQYVDVRNTARDALGNYFIGSISDR